MEQPQPRRPVGYWPSATAGSRRTGSIHGPTIRPNRHQPERPGRRWTRSYEITPHEPGCFPLSPNVASGPAASPARRSSPPPRPRAARKHRPAGPARNPDPPTIESVRSGPPTSSAPPGRIRPRRDKAAAPPDNVVRRVRKRWGWKEKLRLRHVCSPNRPAMRHNSVKVRIVGRTEPAPSMTVSRGKTQLKADHRGSIC